MGTRLKTTIYPRTITYFQKEIVYFAYSFQLGQDRWGQPLCALSSISWSGPTLGWMQDSYKGLYVCMLGS